MIDSARGVKRVTAPIRLSIVEDDARYRSSLEQLFRSASGFELVGSYPTAASLVREIEDAARAGRPPGLDLLLLDLELPGMGGIEATRRLKAAAPDVKVVILTVFEQPETILEAICAGADGYLLKKARALELLEALRGVASGGAPLTPNVARRVLDLMRELAPERVSGPALPHPSRLDLTEREQQVLRGLVEGCSYKQVADMLGISLGTVRTHITATYRKLRVHSVVEALRRARRDRIL